MRSGRDVHTPLGSLYRFGPFQVNCDSGELLKNGNRVKLQEQPFRLLVILLENAGEVVTRDDLRHRIWRDDTFVDFDSSLRVAVGKLREALGDDAENPRYVETIPKRGYRFLAPETYPEPVDGIGELGASPSSAETAAPDDPRIGAPFVYRANWSRRWMLSSVLLLIVVAGVAIAFRTFRQHRPQEREVLTAVPFTALPGQATSPAFSPDGSRIAFAWNGDPEGGAKGFRSVR
jgi:DNA-binding winged helix-turn-helix (wHTH) protein